VAAPQTVSADPGASMQVDVLGGQGTTADWVGLYRVGAANGAWLDWVYLSGTRTAPPTGLYSASFAMAIPNARGPYEVRFFFSSGYDLRATGPTIQSEMRTRAAGGDAHTLLVRADGTLWAAGRNQSGELGDDTTVDKTVPIQIAGLSNVVSVAAGASHSMALTAAGSIYLWGANDVGQVGDGTTTPRLTPTLLSLTDVVAIAAGDHHSMALTASGVLYTWGLNSSGALGNATTTNSNVPIQVATGVTAIGAGDHFTLFVKSDGTVFGTGDNEFGALGDGTTTSRTSPVLMGGANGAVAVRGGRKHSLILLGDGTVLSTGRIARPRLACPR
jgi:alpha-tubulin suppressor-like RCC1 family protein